MLPICSPGLTLLTQLPNDTAMNNTDYLELPSRASGTHAGNHPPVNYQIRNQHAILICQLNTQWRAPVLVAEPSHAHLASSVGGSLA